MRLLGATAAAAVEAAVAFMEASPITNAGIGSCLSERGTVECDATLVDGATKVTTRAIGVVAIDGPVKSMVIAICRISAVLQLHQILLTPSVPAGL